MCTLDADLVLKLRGDIATVIPIRPCFDALSSVGSMLKSPSRTAAMCVSLPFILPLLIDHPQVVLVDLNSHHGTHVRKPDETVSRMLTPQTPTILADGDVITFGKSVGKNESLVRPVVARVDFLHGGQPPLKPLVVPNYHSIGEGSKCLSRANSGRYGVYVPSPSSVSSSDDVSSHDSDIEEISAPCGNIQLLPSIAVDGSLGQAMKALRHIIPSVHSERELSSPSLPSYSPEYQPYSPTSPPEIELQDEFFNVGSDAYDSDISEDSTSDDGHKSRSNSPMDLSSPSSEPFIPSTPLSKAKSVPVEPVVIGAWPTSHSSSPVVTKSPSPPAEVHASIPECDTSQPGEISTPEAEAVVDVAEVGDSEASEIVVLGKEIVPASEAMQLAAAAEEFNGLKSVVNAIKVCDVSADFATSLTSRLQERSSETPGAPAEVQISL